MWEILPDINWNNFLGFFVLFIIFMCLSAIGFQALKHFIEDIF